MLRHVTSGSLAFVPLKLTGRNDLPPFPATLTTRALYPCSLWWFEACPCRPAPGGRPPSPIKLRSVPRRDRTFTAHNAFIFQASPQPLDEDVVHAPALAVHADLDAFSTPVKLVLVN